MYVIQARVMCVYLSIKALFLIRISEGWRFEIGWYQWRWRDRLQLDNLGGWRRAAFLWVLDRYEGIPTKYHCAATWTSFRGDEDSNPVCGLQFLVLAESFIFVMAATLQYITSGINSFFLDVGVASKVWVPHWKYMRDLPRFNLVISRHTWVMIVLNVIQKWARCVCGDGWMCLQIIAFFFWYLIMKCTLLTSCREHKK